MGQLTASNAIFAAVGATLGVVLVRSLLRKKTSRGTLGERAVDISLAELSSGVHGDPPGSHRSDRLDEYRQDHGSPGDNWCAWGFSWAGSSALRPGERLPHNFTGSVADLVRSGHFHYVSSDYRPRVGDGVILRRNDQDPAAGGQGHVGRLITAPDVFGSFETIEANSLHDAWGLRKRKTSDSDISGWLEYPQTVARESTKGDFPPFKLMPLPAGFVSVKDVTPEMSAWAKTLLSDASFEMGQVRARAFGNRKTVARAEVHPPSVRIDHPHRGISLFESPSRTA